MIRALVRILACLTGIHVLRPGVTRAHSFRFECDRCGKVLPGHLAVRR